MSVRLIGLRQKRAELKDKARAITSAADAAGLDLTDEENAKIDAYIEQVAQVEASIEREEKLADLDRATTVESPTAHIEVQDRAELDQKKGFKTFGEFARTVMQAGVGNGIDDRLLIGAAAPSTYGNEGSGADGGFLVPGEFANTIKQHTLDDGAFLPLTDMVEISGNSMTFPRDETTPWGTNGIRAYWENEAAAATATKPVIGADTMRLNKLMALVPVTDELMADSSALSGYLMSKTGSSIRWKTNDALINGTGAGNPLGILNASCLVSVAKETSQTAATVNATNVVKMFARMPAESMGGAVWIVNNNVLPQLQLMTIGDTPIWAPPNGLIGGAVGTLLGRPVMVSQSCQTLGTVGDIYLADWKSYSTIAKAGGIDYQTSIHLYFDAGATAFRATYRLDGQPWLTSAISPANGSDTLSPFVALATRA